VNKRNLQTELEKIIADHAGDAQRPSLLLHTCCAPCSSYCLEYLAKVFDITVYYCNPNIDDEDEYIKRRDEQKRLIDAMNQNGSFGSTTVKFTEGSYDPEEWHQLVRGHEQDKEGGERCGICFRARLGETARYAAENGFDYFTTSLSISPLKNAQRLCDIGEEEAKACAACYLPTDFKKKGGYLRSIELSKIYGLYRQNYCGCSYSKAASEKENGNG